MVGSRYEALFSGDGALNSLLAVLAIDATIKGTGAPDIRWIQVPYSYGLYTYGQYTYGLYTYGLYSNGLYSYGRCSHCPRHPLDPGSNQQQKHKVRTCGTHGYVAWRICCEQASLAQWGHNYRANGLVTI